MVLPLGTSEAWKFGLVGLNELGSESTTNVLKTLVFTSMWASHVSRQLSFMSGRHCQKNVQKQ